MIRNSQAACGLSILVLALISSPAHGQYAFTDVGPQVGLHEVTTAGYMFAYDYDQDADMDLLLTSRFGAEDFMYRNDGGSFTPLMNIGLANSNDAERSAPMDYDQDGDLDLFLRSYHQPFMFFEFQGGVFTERTAEVGLPVTTGATAFDWMDIDRDGHMDLLIGFRYVINGFRMYRNTGHGTFEDITESTNLPSISGMVRIGVADADLDGDLDIYVTTLHYSDYYLVNQGDGTFVDRTDRAGFGDAGGTGDVVWADFTYDGWPDLLTQAPTGHTIYRNNQNGTFTEMAVYGMEVSLSDEWWSPRYAVADYDGDKDLEIYSANCGWNADEDLMANQFFHMDSVGVQDIWFTDLAPELEIDYMNCSSAGAFDYDLDGDLDLIVRKHWEPTSLLRNDANSQGYLQLRVLGDDGSNDCWHTRVEICPAGVDQPLVSSETNTGGAYRNGLRHHFGLDSQTSYDIHLYFINGDEMHPEEYPALRGIVPDQNGSVLTIYRSGEITGTPDAPAKLPHEYSLRQNYPNPFNAETTISFILSEPGMTTLTIYNTLGRIVATPLRRELASGPQSIQFTAAELPTGLYFYRLDTDHFTATRKMILMK